MTVMAVEVFDSLPDSSVAVMMMPMDGDVLSGTLRYENGPNWVEYVAPDGVMFFVVPLPPMDHDALTDAMLESSSVTSIVIVDARAVPGGQDSHGSSSSQIAFGVVNTCPRMGGVSSGGGGGSGIGASVDVVVSGGGGSGRGAGAGASVDVVVPARDSDAGLTGAGSVVSSGTGVSALVESGAPRSIDDVPVKSFVDPGPTVADGDASGDAAPEAVPVSGGRVMVTANTCVSVPASAVAACPFRAIPTAVTRPTRKTTNAARPMSSRR